MALFESYERRIDKINAVLAQYGIASIEEAKAICDEKGLDPYKMCEETQPICFENAKWAYVVGAAIADSLCLLDALNTILCKHSVNLINSALIALK